MFTVSASFELDRSRIARMLRLPSGMVYRNMERRVRRVEAEAIRGAPGSMKQRIRVQIQRAPGGEFRGVVKVEHRAAIWVINGTRPHLIRPVRARVLRFTVGGRVVYARLVRHPGSKPNDFLRKALRAGL